MAGDTVANNMIDGNATRFGIATIAQGGGGGTVCQHIIVAEAIQMPGADTDRDMLANHIQNLCRQPTSTAHTVKIARLVNSDTALVYMSHGRGYRLNRPNIQEGLPSRTITTIKPL